MGVCLVFHFTNSHFTRHKINLFINHNNNPIIIVIVIIMNIVIIITIIAVVVVCINSFTWTVSH